MDGQHHTSLHPGCDVRSPNASPVSLPQPLYPYIAGQTALYRSKRALNGLRKVPEAGITTVLDLVHQSAERYSAYPALGSRTRTGTHFREIASGAAGDIKTLSSGQLTGYAFTTYQEYARLVHDLGSGLRKVGLKPRVDKLCIWAQTCAEWLSIFHGAASQAIPVVTACSGPGLSGIQHALTSTEAASLFVDSRGLERLEEVLDAAPGIQLVIYSGPRGALQEKQVKLRSKYGHVRLFHINDVQLFGSEEPVELVSLVPDDLCAIFYTSGSTGRPKGVPLSHANVVAAVVGWDGPLGRHLGNNDRYLAYLPLDHMVEFTTEHLCIYRGVCIGYGTPRTMFDSGVYNCMGDLRELRPTYMAGVPAFWESVRKAILALTSKLLPDEQTAFWQAFEERKVCPRCIFPPNLSDSRLTKFREILGGQLRFALTEGAPLATDTQEFLSYVIAPLVGGLSMTETTAVAAMTDPSQWQSGSLGGVPDCAELKLVDEPALGYLTSNIPPEGEIWIRSHSTVKSYYNDDSETAKAFTEDGWYKTKDIGRIDARGVLTVIDRQTNLAKTLNGEFIALEKLEAIYRSCKALLNVCLYADPMQNRPIAIVLPHRPAIDVLLKDGSFDSYATLDTTTHAAIEQLVLQQLQTRARESRLNSTETVNGVVLSHLEDWNALNGMTTVVGTLNRRGIYDFHKEAIRELLVNAEDSRRFGTEL